MAPVSSLGGQGPWWSEVVEALVSINPNFEGGPRLVQIWCQITGAIRPLLIIFLPTSPSGDRLESRGTDPHQLFPSADCHTSRASLLN